MRLSCLLRQDSRGCRQGGYTENFAPRWVIRRLAPFKNNRFLGHLHPTASSIAGKFPSDFHLVAFGIGQNEQHFTCTNALPNLFPKVEMHNPNPSGTRLVSECWRRALYKRACLPPCLFWVGFRSTWVGW